MKFSISTALSAAATLGTLAFSGSAALAAAEVVLQSGPERASLLELYTSEGCSSCPPAEVWLSRLRNDPRLWKEIVPVAFHVDYWDNLGWKDRFASAAFTARQREYAARWNSGSIYTPGFVLDGREWRGWSSQREIPTQKAAAAGGALSISVPAGGRTATVAYRAAAPAAPGDAREIFLAVLGFDIKSDVKAGENRGRALAHDFVALSCEKQPLPLSQDGSVEFRIAPKPAGVGRQALAAWVVKAGASEPEGAVGGWLP